MNISSTRKILLLRASCSNDFSGISYIAAEFEPTFLERFRDLKPSLDFLFSLLTPSSCDFLEINAESLGTSLTAYRCTTGLEEILSAAGRDWAITDSIPDDSVERMSEGRCLRVGRLGRLRCKLLQGADVAHAEIAPEMLSEIFGNRA